ncbi:MAG: ABC transporter permease, partial [Sciscionella sp.]
IMFAVILTPLMFTGSIQFPWQSLNHERWFQVVCAINPLTYFSEAMRALLVAPSAVHSIPLVIDLPIMLAALAVVGAIGIKGFLRRSLD